MATAANNSAETDADSVEIDWSEKMWNGAPDAAPLGDPQDVIVDYDGEYDEAYKDPDVLRTLYWVHGLSQYEMAKLIGGRRKPIRYWMKKHGIPRRKSTHEQYGCLTLYSPRNVSYECFEVATPSGGDDRVRVHRLCAVAWFGLEETKNKHVHHCEIECGFLNVEWNLELMAHGEHVRLHRTLNVDLDKIETLYFEEGLTQYEVADRLDISQWTVSERIHEYDLGPNEDTEQTVLTDHDQESSTSTVGADE